MLTIKNPGFYTSIQDLGRFGYRHLGVPVSGALDLKAFSMANSLLENNPNDAVLEITMTGPDLEFAEPTYVALSGAPLEARLQGELLEMNRVYKVPAGALLESGHVREGLRSYLAIKGGLLSGEFLGSRSQFYPITPSGTVKKNEQIPYKPITDFSPKLLKVSMQKPEYKPSLIVSPGPEYQNLKKESINLLFNNSFQISKNHNRMACQLEPILVPHQMRMITSATLPGTVQITPSGRLIILLRDGQTTGGYPRILQLDRKSLDQVAQMQFGDMVRFKNPD